MGLSAEEIAKVKEEYDERQRKKAEKEKEKEKEEKEKDKEKEGENQEKEVEVKSKTKDKPAALSSTGAATPPKATHERYTLHRDYFASTSVCMSQVHDVLTIQQCGLQSIVREGRLRKQKT